jgi:hypothetical protein
MRNSGVPEERIGEQCSAPRHGFRIRSYCRSLRIYP